MKKVILNDIRFPTPSEKQTEKNFSPVDILLDKWYFGGVFGNDILTLQNWKKGDEVIVELYQQEYNGKTYDKWKYPTAFQVINWKLDLVIDLLSVPDAEPKQSQKSDAPPDDLPF